MHEPDSLLALQRFRQEVYRSGLGHRKASLFDLADAVLSGAGATSLVRLSLAPAFRRRWPSISDALADGALDVAALRALVLGALPPRRPGSARCGWWTGPPGRGRRPRPARSGPTAVGSRPGCRRVAWSPPGNTSGCWRSPRPKGAGGCRWMSAAAARPPARRPSWRSGNCARRWAGGRAARRARWWRWTAA